MSDQNQTTQADPGEQNFQQQMDPNQGQFNTQPEEQGQQRQQVQQQPDQQRDNEQQFDPNQGQQRPDQQQFDPNQGQQRPDQQQFDPNQGQQRPDQQQPDPNQGQQQQVNQQQPDPNQDQQQQVNQQTDPNQGQQQASQQEAMTGQPMQQEQGNQPGPGSPVEGAMVPAGTNGDQNLPEKLKTGFAGLDDLEPARLAALIRENLPDDGLSFRDLNKITVPSQGRVTWVYEKGGEEVSTRNLTGVIIHNMIQRAYWEKSPEESGGFAPPDCSSTDGMTGVGNPGGACRTCPLNQFGETGGKPCRETRLIYLLDRDRRMPSVLQAPPTSLPNIRRYLTELTTEEFVPQWAVETNLTLDRVEGGNYPYSRIVPKISERLPEHTVAKMQEYVNSIKPFLTQAAHKQDFTNGDYIDAESSQRRAEDGDVPALASGQT